MSQSSQTRYINHSGRPPADAEDLLDIQHDIEDELLSSVDIAIRQPTGRHGVYIGAPGERLAPHHCRVLTADGI